jgi:type IV secretory pathway VirB2 component (pilin)
MAIQITNSSLTIVIITIILFILSIIFKRKLWAKILMILTGLFIIFILFQLVGTTFS